MELQQGIQLGEEITEGKRFYSFEGKKYPSVTTVLGATRDNTFLDAWKKKNPNAGNEAITRGLAVHKAIEQYILDGSIPTEEGAVTQFFSLVKPLLDNLTPTFIETAIVSKEYGFAGRVDAGGYYGEIPLIIDWKTASKPKRNWYDYPLQLAAYVKGYSETYGTSLYNQALLVCISPGKVQIELYEPEQINYYWQQFEQRLSAFYALPQFSQL